jgi:glyoxylase-like metal-dependent hydrolase (beta-lactamase superfamily II)
MATYQQTVSQKLVPQLTGKTPQELERSIENYNHYPLRKKKLGPIEIINTPGHTPDSICIVIDNFIITGDHILPYITPGASVRLGYPRSLPQESADEYPQAEHYGLSVYLDSLAQIETLGEQYSLLPGHFLSIRGQVRWQTTRRAKQIASNQLKQTKSILDLMEDAPMDLITVAQRHFHPRVIQERGLERSLASIAGNIDFLLEHGYLRETENGKLFRQHTKQFDL